MMEAVRTSETSVDNHSTRQYNPEDSSEHITMDVCWRTKYTSTLIYLFLPILAKLLARGTSVRYITTNSGTGCFCYKKQKHQAFRILRSEIKLFFLKIIVFWDLAPYSLVEVHRRFRGVYFILTTVRTKFHIFFSN
jgi:hypothetical protein